MPRSTTVIARRVATLMACAVLFDQAASAGIVALHNDLPVPAFCAAETFFSDAPRANGQPGPQYLQLFSAQLAPGASQVVHVPAGTWPSSVSFDADGVPFSSSRYFGTLLLSCGTRPAGAGGSEYVVRLINTEGYVALESVHGSDSTFRIGPEIFDGNYELKSYTPNDDTAFVVRLGARDALATAEQLRAGAPLSIAVNAMPLLPDGSALFDEAIALGRYALVTPQDDSGDVSSAASRSFSAQLSAPQVRAPAL